MRPCDKSIKATIGLAERMLKTADEGDAVREDNGCGVLYGVLRDCGFKIMKLAQTERDTHIRKGWWKEQEDERPGKRRLRHRILNGKT